MKGIKKLTALLLAMALLLSLLPAGILQAGAEGTTVPYAVEGGNVYFDKSTGTITSCDDTVTSVVIPSAIEGVPVTAIGLHAFNFCNSLTNVVISNGVTTIGEYAFSWCDGLTSITIPTSVTTISDSAFLYCDSLTGIWVNEENVNYSSDAYGLLFSKDKTKLLQCPGGYSGAYTIPDSVTAIGDNAFIDCADLVGIWVNEENVSYSSDENGVLFNKDKTRLVQCPGGYSGTYTIPDRVTTIGDNAFYGCDSLTSVIIPDSVTTIGYCAFYGCSSLTSITIPDSVTTVGSLAFCGCTRLSSITVPDNGLSIGSSAFNSTVYYNDKNNWMDGILYLENYLLSARYDIPGKCFIREGTIGIAESAFESCFNPFSVYIPDSMDSIDDGAFRNCTGLSDVHFSSSVTSIGDYAFAGCTGLIYMNNIPSSVTSIGDYAFAGCTGLIYMDNIPSSVTSIGDYAFDRCTSLTDLTIPNSKISIGKRAFEACTGLSSVTIGSYEKGEIAIDAYAFNDCKALTSVTFLSSVKTIKSRVFAGCTQLAHIDIPDGESIIYSNVFRDTAYYKDNANWIENVLYIGNHLIEARKTISGSCAIRKGTKTIAWQAFQDCNELSTVMIPDSIAVIGDFAFFSCDNLTGIWVDEENEVYSSDTNGILFSEEKTTLLQCPGGHSGTYTIPTGVTDIGESAFEECINITGVVIPDSVTTISYFAFYHCSSLADVYYYGSKEQWNKIAIYACNDDLLNATVHYNYVPEPEPVENPFEDVKEEDYFAEPVLWAVENGITNGTSEGKFSPDRSCTRGQIVTFLWRAAGSPEPTTSENPFSDLQETDYFYKAVLWAVEEGITTGTGKGKFSPDKACTRGQVATFLWRAQGEPKTQNAENPFADLASGEYYYEAVLWAVEQGITNGTGKGKFSPDKDCTRGQIVTFLYRAMA